MLPDAAPDERTSLAPDLLQRPAAPPGRRTVFLHTGWRSGGTWIWSRCREQAGVHALYEPLHEDLAWLKVSDISALSPGSWASNHSQTAPYFQEYQKLLLPGRRRQGVPLYRERFAFEDFFRAPEDDDAELGAYLTSLLGAAGSGQVSVIKFCRSLGRVGWLQARFPDALHAVVLRDPAAQWASAQALLSDQRNRYFALAPAMVLARNAHTPCVQVASAGLGVRLPALHSGDLAYVKEVCWWHLRHLEPVMAYRQFLAFWTVTAVKALAGDTLAIQTDQLAHDDTHRASVEAALSGAIGASISLTVQPGAAARLDRTPALPRDAMRSAHQDAAALLLALGHDMPPNRLDMLLTLLGSDLAAPLPAGKLQERARPIAAPPRRLDQRLVTQAVVLGARTLLPLRRLHGLLTRWRGRPRRQIT